jgi:hypothetical protein
MNILWRSSIISAALLVLLSLAPNNTAAQARPIPPGVRAADHAEEQSQQQLEPPSGPVSVKLSAAELLQQSDELLALSQQVHADVKSATQGLLAKDLKDKLKRMEKLSKRLREELSP